MNVAVASFEANSRARMSTRFFCRRSWTLGGTLISLIMHDFGGGDEDAALQLVRGSGRPATRTGADLPACLAVRRPLGPARRAGRPFPGAGRGHSRAPGARRGRGAGI